MTRRKTGKLNENTKGLRCCFDYFLAIESWPGRLKLAKPCDGGSQALCTWDEVHKLGLRVQGRRRRMMV